MTVTPSEATTETDLDLVAVETAEDLDLAIPEEVPTADDPSSRAK